MDLWIPFYDQISDYFSTYFWLYHPGDPDHSAYCAAIVSHNAMLYRVAFYCNVQGGSICSRVLDMHFIKFSI